MSGRELVVRKRQEMNGLDLREIAARTTLREVRLQGHAYVELRRPGATTRAGKRVIFFCTLCLTPCYNDAVLFDHLRGNLHARRYDAAKLTLLGPHPWPFNDGVLFFNNEREKDHESSLVSASGSTMALVVRNSNGDEATSKLKENDANVSCSHNDGNCHDSNGDNLEIVAYGHENSPTSAASLILANHNGDRSRDSCDSRLQIVTNGHEHSSNSSGNMDLAVNGHNGLTVPGILIKNEVSNLRVQFMGFGQVGARMHEIDEVHSKISKIWCAWLGDGNFDNNDSFPVLPKCDFAIVSFSYTYDLGRKAGVDDESTLLLPAGSLSEIEDVGSPMKRRKKSFSDPEDSSESPIDHSISNADDCSSMSDCTGNGTHELHISRLMLSKAARRELRKRKRLHAERICDICAQPMLPGKDVAALLNLMTGNLACSSRNTHGAFHLFHASCLIHWILFCEFEMWGNLSAKKKTTRRRKGKASAKKHTSKPISSVFCPECQGTGAYIEGYELEKPIISLSEMFLYKLKVIEAHKAWMKKPEVLQKCSTGLHFLSDPIENSQGLHFFSDPIVNSQGTVVPLKLLSFYQAAE